MSKIGNNLLTASYGDDVGGLQHALTSGVRVDYADPETGMTALHIAAGTNNLTLVRCLVEEWNAPFGPDRKGRWPTSIAARSRASEELCDYIVEAESAYMNSIEGPKPVGS